MSLGNWSAMPPGAVASTCMTPMPNKMISQSFGTPQFCSRAGRNACRNAAMTAPARLNAPPMRTTARRLIEFWIGKSIENSSRSAPASSAPATPVTNADSASAQSL